MWGSAAAMNTLPLSPARPAPAQANESACASRMEMAASSSLGADAREGALERALAEVGGSGPAALSGQMLVSGMQHMEVESGGGEGGGRWASLQVGERACM